MSADLTESLTRAGLDPEEVSAKGRLAGAAAAGLARLTSREPEAACWVPGRLELFGTHTDYAGGRTLVAALPQGFIFTGCPGVDRQVRVLDARTGEQVVIAPALAPPAVHGWQRYVSAVVQRLARNFPGVPLAADVSLASDLPIAAGMSSSSALMVGLAVTLIRLAGIRDSAIWRDNITSPVDEAGYYACIENGRDFRALTGNAGVGTHGGSEDHAAMLCCERRTFTAFAFVPMRPLAHARLPRDWSCLVASSGVAAEKTGPAQRAYNRLAAGAAVLLEIWNRHAPGAASLGDALRSEPAAPARLHQMIDSTPVPDWTLRDLHSRLQHFTAEDARVPQAVEALRQRDTKTLGELSERSQRDAQTSLGNQIEETVALADLARRHGAFASRSFGAGFGGSVWALVEHQSREVFARAWLDAYRARYPQRESTVFEGYPSLPMLELLTQR